MRAHDAEATQTAVLQKTPAKTRSWNLCFEDKLGIAKVMFKWHWCRPMHQTQWNGNVQLIRTGILLSVFFILLPMHTVSINRL